MPDDFTPHKCTICGNITVSVRKMGTTWICLNCYMQLQDGKAGKPTRKPVQREAAIQSEFFRVFPLKFPHIPNKLLFAVPNGGSRNKLEAANLKRQGVKAGVADVILQVPAKWYNCLCLEFKTPSGKQSPEQQEFQRQIELAGGKYIVARSVQEALEEVDNYLNDGKHESEPKVGG